MHVGLDRELYIAAGVAVGCAVVVVAGDVETAVDVAGAVVAKEPVAAAVASHTQLGKDRYKIAEAIGLGN